MALGWKRVVLRGVKQLNAQDQTVYEMKFVDDEDLEVSGDGSTGADVVLTGYEAVDDDDIEATDTVNEALAKLAARVQALEDAP